MSPLNIHFLLYVYAFVRDEDWMLNFNENEMAITYLLDNGLIQCNCSTDKAYKLTEKGECYVDFIINIPLPVSTWSIPE